MSSPCSSLQASYMKPTAFLSRPACHIVQIMDNCTITRAVDERTFVCIEEAPSLWPPGTVCQRGTRAWAQSNASSWHCAYDTSNSLNYVQLTVIACVDLFRFLHVFLRFNLCTKLRSCPRTFVLPLTVMNMMLDVQIPFGLLIRKSPFLLAIVLLHIGICFSINLIVRHPLWHPMLSQVGLILERKLLSSNIFALKDHAAFSYS